MIKAIILYIDKEPGRINEDQKGICNINLICKFIFGFSLIDFFPYLIEYFSGN